MDKGTQLCRFREILYQNLDKRADAILNFVDALSSNTGATSVVELSLNPLFTRSYSSVYAAQRDFALSPEKLAQVLQPALPQTRQRSFWQVSLDVTPCPRLYASTLSDRTMVYQPTVVRGNKPVTIGYRYSWLFLHRERSPGTPPWVVPLSVRRAKSDEDGELVGAEQVLSLLPELPIGAELTVCTADTAYSKPEFLLRLTEQENLVAVVRVRNNRVFYRRYEPSSEEPRPKGHPRWYGEKMALNDPTTWLPPDQETEIPRQTHRGEPRRLRIRAWYKMVQRGKKGYRGHEHPFTLVCYERLKPDGQPVHPRPVWLIIFGPRQAEIDVREAVPAYIQRYDGEHFFRFGKRHLLMTANQTPDTATEEKWMHIVQLAYLQLWLARNMAQAQWPPWQKHQAARQQETASCSPTQVQRDFSRIIQQVGSPARLPKRRGKSPGRKSGVRLTPRPRHKVVKKRKKVA